MSEKKRSFVGIYMSEHYWYYRPIQKNIKTGRKAGDAFVDREEDAQAVDRSSVSFFFLSFDEQ